MQFVVDELTYLVIYFYLFSNKKQGGAKAMVWWGLHKKDGAWKIDRNDEALVGRSYFRSHIQQGSVQYGCNCP